METLKQRKLSELVGVGKWLQMHDLWELDAYRKSGEFPRVFPSKAIYEQRAEDEALALLQARDKRLQDICSKKFELPVYINLPRSLWYATRVQPHVLNRTREWTLSVSGCEMVAYRPGQASGWRVEISFVRLINLYEAVTRDPEMYLKCEQGPVLMAHIKEAWERYAVPQGFVSLEQWNYTPRNAWDFSHGGVVILRLNWAEDENTTPLSWVQYEILKLLYLDNDDDTEYTLIEDPEKS